METALYFPRIRVPETSWFTHVLLYWDRAASIVPFEMDADNPEIGPYMSELARANLLVPIHPAMYLPGRNEAILGLMESVAPNTSPRQWRWADLHSGKINGSLFGDLRDRGLARISEGGDRGAGDRWELEENVAGLYMAYLAGSICGAREGFFPVTDTSRSVAMFGPDGRSTEDRLRALHYSVILEALPAPSGPIPVAELVSFKDKYRDELRRLRVHLDSHLVELATIGDEVVQRVKIANALQEIGDEVAVLREQMNKRQWPKTLLVGVGGVVGSAIALATTVATGGAALTLGLAAGSGVLALGGSAYQAAQMLATPRFDRRAPLVYAALASRL